MEMELEVQGCRRAGPVLSASCPTLFLPTVQTMDDDDAAYNPFSSSHVWKQTANNDELGTYELSLFAPLELDSRSSRVPDAQTRRHVSDRC